MAKENRHVRGKTNEIIVPIHGNTVVDAGDLMWMDDGLDALKGAAVTADYYAYPFEAAVEINDTSSVTAMFTALEDQFIGIAMESSPSGVTENISVATAGVFRMPMPADSGVTATSLVSAVSPAASVISSSTVAGESSTGYSAHCLLGYVTKSQASPATHVEFVVRTKYNGGVAT